jgi:asparagine synthase (glutamine-hydrolysing)
MQEQSTDPVKTFTIRFDDPQFNEADHARAVAAHLKTDHHEELCDERQMLAIVDRLPDIYDEPFGDSSAIPTYLVSAAARKQVTVALSGDGGDELFFGYPRYRFHALGLHLLSLPRGARRMLAAAASRAPVRRVRRVADVLRSDDPDTYARFVAWQSIAEVARTAPGAVPDAPLYKDMFRRGSDVAPELLPGFLDLALYLPDDILAKVDRASMAVSLEVRAPLLDHRVAQFAVGLPLHLKRRGTTMKWLLRRLLYKRVPRALIDRPKMGFGVPLGSWFRRSLRDQMDDYCRSGDLESLDLDPAPIRKMWLEFKEGGHHRPDLIWQAFVLMAWARRFLPAALPTGSGAAARR